jgi:hypothetical protein
MEPPVPANHGDTPDKQLPTTSLGGWFNKTTLTRRGALLGMTAVAGVAAVDVGVFGYAGGWLRPDALTHRDSPIVSNRSRAVTTASAATTPKASVPVEHSPATGLRRRSATPPRLPKAPSR